MRVKDIWPELLEISGSCDEGVNYRALTRAVEMLSTGGLFDPQIGTLTMNVSGDYLIALPRDVKAPIRINIDNHPSFSRSRIFEFEMNTDGADDSPGIGWQWHDRGYYPVQKVTHQPTRVAYNVVNVEDNNKTLTVWGIDHMGFERTETLVGLTAGATESEHQYREFTRISRQPTIAEAFLEGTSAVMTPPAIPPALPANVGILARFYGDEEEPSYRIIKLSKTGVAIKVRYRKHTFKLSSQEDIIPLHSPMAVLRAFDAVRMMMKKQYAEAEPVLESARQLLASEQAARDEGVNAAMETEVQTSLNRPINANGVVIVADIYDEASRIFGPVGREKLFDRISDAVEALQNKTAWESCVGDCTLSKANFSGDYNLDGSQGHGYFTLPRYVHSVLHVNVNGRPGIPRNRWFEYHLNGTGERNVSSCGTWDDIGEVATINRIPIRYVDFSTGREVPTFDSTIAFSFDSLIFPTFDMTVGTFRSGSTLKIVPSCIIATPEDATDEDKLIRVFGIEELADGRHVEVYRDGIRGWTCPCKVDSASYDCPSDTPRWVRIDRITRAKTRGFVTLATIGGSPVTLGYWYPDELEPRYKIIRVPYCTEAQVRVRYRKHSYKIESLDDVINLRSRLAMSNMMMALAKQQTDMAAADAHEATAVRYLIEEMLASNPVIGGPIQFDPYTTPAVTCNID